MILPDLQGKKTARRASLAEKLFQPPINPLFLEQPVDPRPHTPRIDLVPDARAAGGVPPDTLRDQLLGEASVPLPITVAAPSVPTHPIIEPVASAVALGAVGGDGGILTGAEATVATIFRHFGGAYLEQYGATSSDEQLRVLQLLTLCRTPSLGFSQWECAQCGHVHETYNPCRDRHCPQCQNHLSRQWYDARQNDILPLAHQHVILTAPHDIQVLLDVWENRKVVYRCFMHATRDALQQVAADTLGLALGLLIILHTWNQLVEQHLHTHTVLPGGGWLLDGPRRFVTPADATWLDQERLMKAFRAALLAHLSRVAERGKLVFAGRAAFLDDGVAFGDWIERMRRRDWVVRLRPPLDNADAALGYLARYARGVAFGNRRIVALDPRHGMVTLAYRHNEAGADGQDITDTKTIDAVEFIRRFLLHVMPKGMSRVQTYGWWSSGQKGKELPRIRVQLGVALEEEAKQEQQEDAPEAALPEETDEVPRAMCPLCRQRSLERVLQVPTPRLCDLMRIVLWPRQKKEPLETQALLPDMEAWLPGGDAFMASLYAQLPFEPTSGFT